MYLVYPGTLHYPLVTTKKSQQLCEVIYHYFRNYRTSWHSLHVCDIVLCIPLYWDYLWCIDTYLPNGPCRVELSFFAVSLNLC